MTSSTPGATAGTATLTGATHVLLVRHGVTDLTASGRLDGRGGCDPDLNTDGRRQAEAVGQAVHDLVHDLAHHLVNDHHLVHDLAHDGPCRVVTSSLTRAAQTGDAVAAALGVGPERDAGWDEQGFGDWDGQSVAHLHETVPDELRRLRADHDYARPGGESLAVVQERVLAAWDRAVAPGGTVVVVTSRKPILVVLARVLALPPRAFWTLSTDPASVTALDLWPDGNASVPFTNRTDHLR